MKTGKEANIVIAVLALGVLTSGTGMAAELESASAAGAQALSSAFSSLQSVQAAKAERERRRELKSPADLLREADDKDTLASLPPPTEKEWCEAGGHHVFVISAKTGRKYCIPAFTDRGGGERGGGERLKTKVEIAQEVAANDSFPESKPPTEKEWCELGGNHLFVISPKTGNKYCITSTTDRGGGERGGGERPKTKWEIDREIEANDYFAQNPPAPRTPKQECEAFGDKAYVQSSKGNYYCLEKYTDN